MTRLLAFLFVTLAACTLKCRVPDNLSFCTMVDYPTAEGRRSFHEKDAYAATEFQYYWPQQLQTEDCREAYKAYICAYHFPKCPYCDDLVVICREDCVEVGIVAATQLTARSIKHAAA